MTADQFGPYRLEKLIGRGGMGEVYRAYDTVRKRVVALKRLPASLAADPAFQARFRAESELAARLRSAHVIPTTTTARSTASSSLTCASSTARTSPTGSPAGGRWHPGRRCT